MNSIDLKKIREDLGLTQQGFASYVGVDRRTIVNWESGGKIPNSRIKMLELLKEGAKTFSIEEKSPAKSENKSSNDLTREILELKDHIDTLKKFLDEKSTISEFYKVENLKLKEEIEALKNG